MGGAFEIRRAGPDDADAVAALFDAYRRFYRCEPDLAGARTFIGERLARADSVIFLVAGVYADWHVLVLALVCVPAMLLGTWIGHHLTLRMSREVFLRSIYLMLLVSGGSLIVRAWLM